MQLGLFKWNLLPELLQNIYINMLADMAGVEELNAQLTSEPAQSSRLSSGAASASSEDW